MYTEKLTPESVLQAILEIGKRVDAFIIAQEQRAIEQRAAEEKRAAEQKATHEKHLAELKAENDRRAAENDRRAAENEQRRAETDRQIEENKKNNAELRKHMKGTSYSNGMLAEEAVFEVLNKSKTFAKITFPLIRQNVPIVSADHQTLTDLDVLMINGNTVSIVETKYRVDKDDVVELLDTKLALFRQYFTDYKNHKVILGIGGMSFEKNAEDFATKKGIGIIKIVGEQLEYNTDNIIEY